MIKSSQLTGVCTAPAQSFLIINYLIYFHDIIRKAMTGGVNVLLLLCLYIHSFKQAFVQYTLLISTL